MNFRNLFARLASGTVYVAVVLWGILAGGYAFLAVFGLFLGAGLYEFYRMTGKEASYSVGKVFNIASGLLLFGSTYLYLEDLCRHALPVIAVAYLLVLFVSEIFVSRTSSFRSVVFSVFGQIYLTFPISLLMFVSHRYGSFVSEYEYVFLLALFLFIWINDTAAFVVGSLIGKHKLIERISPKKTIEGFVGGVLFSILAGGLFSQIFNAFSPLFWIGFGAATALSATLGDLFESLIKRTCGVKDSGNLIPGHGGILDRIDSLLIAVPAVYIYFSAVFAA